MIPLELVPKHHLNLNPTLMWIPIQVLLGVLFLRLVLGLKNWHGSLGCFSKGLCISVYFSYKHSASDHRDARHSLKYSNVILCITHEV